MISIIIPLYYADVSQYQTIKRCFDSLETSGFDGELIVINDDSPLECYDFPTTVLHKTNFGFTKTVNDGLRIATGDILVVANQDIVFTPELLEKLKKINFGVYSPKTTDEGDGDRFGSIWGMSRKVYQLLGPLDERFQHFFSDLDYYKRAKQMGVPVIKWPIVIEHEGNNAYQFADKQSFYEQGASQYVEKYGQLE